MAEPLHLERPAGTTLIDPVRELVSEGRLPLYWRCGQGTCGACLVYLSHAGQPAELQMSGKERNVLARKGLLNEAQRSAPSLCDEPALPRLACHVLLPAGEVMVRF